MLVCKTEIVMTVTIVGQVHSTNNCLCLSICVHISCIQLSVTTLQESFHHFFTHLRVSSSSECHRSQKRDRDFGVCWVGRRHVSVLDKEQATWSSEKSLMQNTKAYSNYCKHNKTAGQLSWVAWADVHVQAQIRECLKSFTSDMHVEGQCCQRNILLVQIWKGTESNVSHFSIEKDRTHWITPGQKNLFQCYDCDFGRTWLSLLSYPSFCFLYM